MPDMRSYPYKDREGFQFEMLAIPWAFINGLFLGGWMLRKGRQYFEKGPQD